jgi:hypothetical protein
MPAVTHNSDLLELLDVGRHLKHAGIVEPGVAARRGLLLLALFLGLGSHGAGVVYTVDVTVEASLVVVNKWTNFSRFHFGLRK